MPSSTLVSRIFSTPRQTTHYLECWLAGGPLMISSRAGRSSVDCGAPNGRVRCRRLAMGSARSARLCGSFAPAANDAYTIKEIVADMAELYDHRDGRVGHDWGSVVAGALIAHESNCSPGVMLYRKDLFEDPKEKSAFKAKYGRELEVPQTFSDAKQVTEFFTRPDRQKIEYEVVADRRTGKSSADNLKSA
jgi:hypothetical protein